MATDIIGRSSPSAVILDSFTTSPESVTVEEGDTVLQFCVHGGSVPPASITWTRNGDVIVASSRTLIQTSVLEHTDPPQVTSTLAISPVEQGDSGSYRCIATNEALGTSSLSEEGVVTISGEYMGLPLIPLAKGFHPL